MVRKAKTEQSAPDWKVAEGMIAYEDALSFMEERVTAIRNGDAQDLIWLLEHPPLYTAGTSAKAKDLLNPQFPVFETGRGGQYTYHGPGQRVAYVMMDLKKRTPDLKNYVWNLEEWIIRALTELGVKGERREGRVGIWVRKNDTEAKIAAIGVRVRKWVTYHGIAINVDPDLSHYKGIVPCGIAQYGVTSLKDLGIQAEMRDLDKALRKSWAEVF